MADVETRVTQLETGLTALGERVEKLQTSMDTALRGTLDGKPGLLQLTQTSLDASRINSSKLDELAKSVFDMKLDRAKVIGIVIAVSGFWGIAVAILRLLK